MMNDEHIQILMECTTISGLGSIVAVSKTRKYYFKSVAMFGILPNGNYVVEIAPDYGRVRIMLDKDLLVSYSNHEDLDYDAVARSVRRLRR